MSKLEYLANPEEGYGDEDNELKNIAEYGEVNYCNSKAENYCCNAVEGVDRALLCGDGSAVLSGGIHLFGVLHVVVDLIRYEEDLS